MDIVTMALSGDQRNSELLGLATVAQQNNDTEPVDGRIGAVQCVGDNATTKPRPRPSSTSIVPEVGLGLVSDSSIATSGISENGKQVILMMDQEEELGSSQSVLLSETSNFPNTIQQEESLTLQPQPNIVDDGQSTQSHVVQSTTTDTRPSVRITATYTLNTSTSTTSTRPNNSSSGVSSNLMSSIPVELSSSTSAASSILGSIASMIDPSAANITNTSIVPTSTSNNSLTASSSNNTDHVISVNSVPPSAATQQTVTKEPQVQQSTTAIQTKCAATITIKTPPGTSLTGPSGTMSGPLLQSILNNSAVQALMKRNPGQQITIIQIPDDSVGSGTITNLGSNIKSIITETKKNVASVRTNHGGVGRKRKRVDEVEEKAKPQKVVRPVKKITRSGRISRPPLYRMRDYKTIHATEEVETGSSEEDYEDYSLDQHDKDVSIFSDKPRNFKCLNCEKSYIGQASLDRHFRQNPTHGTPVGPSPDKKLHENNTKLDTDDEVKSNNQISIETADVNSSGTTTSSPGIMSRLHTPSTRGRGRGVRKRKGRGRPPIYSNRADKPYSPTAALSNTEKLPLDKRKHRIKELLNSLEDEDFLDVILPRMTRIITPWEFLLMKTEGDKTRKPHFLNIYKEYLTLVQEVRKVAQACLTPVLDEDKDAESSEDGSSTPMMRLNIESEAAANSLGVNAGSYIVKNMLVPINSSHPTLHKVDNCAKAPTELANTNLKQVKMDQNGDVEDVATNVNSKDVATNVNSKDVATNVNSKAMPGLTPLRNRPLNLKSVVTPGPIVEHPIPPGRPLPELKPFPKESTEDSTEKRPTVSPSTSVLSDSLASNTDLGDLTDSMTVPHQDANHLIEPLATGEGRLAEQEIGTESLLQTDVGNLHQLVAADGIQDTLPEVAVDDTSPIDIMPVGSTLMQLQDGTFLVQRPDGTTMQIQAPEGMTIETIQALLSVDGAMHVADADSTEIALTEDEDVEMVSGLDVTSTDLNSEVTAT